MTVLMYFEKKETPDQIEQKPFWLGGSCNIQHIHVT